MNKLFAGCIALAALVSANVFADEYSFTGPNYTHFSDNNRLYTTNMRVTGSFTTSTPIPPNSYNFHILDILTSWSFSDGVQTITNLNGVVYSHLPYGFNTDAQGHVTSGWFLTELEPIAAQATDLVSVITIISFQSVGWVDAVCTGITSGFCNSYGGGTVAWAEVEEGFIGDWTHTRSDHQDFLINPGLNGSWANFDTLGQGFFIDVLPDIPLVFLAWFTWEVDQQAPAQNKTLLQQLAQSGSKSQAVVGDENQRWLTAQGSFAGNSATLDVTLTTGGLFDDPQDVTNSDPGTQGTITLTFTDCKTGTVDYNFTAIGLSGSVIKTS